MIKLLIAGRRAPGRTRRQAHDHLRDIHARMVVRPPPGAGAMPLDYVQNHVIDGAYPGTGDHAIDRDLVTELWFESLDHLKTATTTPYYLEQLRPDEPRFVDDATAAKMMVRADLLRDGERGRFKAFLFTSGGDARKDRFVDLPGIGAVAGNIVLPPPGAAAAFVDLVLEGWFARAGDALGAIERLAKDGVLHGRSFVIAAEEYDTRRLRAHHDVTA